MVDKKIIIIGIAGWAFAHFIQLALNKKDSYTIDPLPKEEETNIKETRK